MDKYRAACAEYAKWQPEIDRLTTAIGAALEGCRNIRDDGKSQHLKDAYEVLYGDDEKMYHVNHDGDVSAYLAGICPHCLDAHIQIKARREARRQYGIAKRRISQLGRGVLLSLNGDNG